MQLKIQASAVSRIQKCPASCHLDATVPDELKYRAFLDASNFGTECHAYGERALLGQKPNVPKEHPRRDDILFAVKKYKDTVVKMLRPRKGGRLFVEDKYRMEIDGVDLVAKSDFLIEGTAKKGRFLDMGDIKTGNYDYTESATEQLIFSIWLRLLYRADLSDEKYMYSDVSGKRAIIQPLYWDEARRVALDAYTIKPMGAYVSLSGLVRRVKAGKDNFCIGQHCKFCPSIVACPAVQQIIKEVENMESVEMNNKNLEIFFGYRDAVTAFFAALEQIIKERLENGEPFDRLSLVPYSGHRKWIDPKIVEKRLKYLGDALFEPRKLKSPSQVEKLAGKENIKGLYDAPQLTKIGTVENPFID